MNPQILDAIKKKAEGYAEKDLASSNDIVKELFKDTEILKEMRKEMLTKHYTSGQVDAIEMMIKFCEWMGEEENPFMMVKGRWFQACGNSTSWTTEQLLLKYMEENKL